MAQQLNTTYPDLTTTEHIPDENRLWDRDKKIINYAKGRLNLMRVMMRRFADQGKKATKDMHVKYASDLDRQALIYLAADSDDYGGGDDNRIWVIDEKANYIDEGAILIARDNYYNGTTYTSTLADGNTQNEALLVTQRGISDGTKTWFLVQRGFGHSLGTPNDLLSGAALLVEPRSIGEGSNEARVWGDVFSEEYNYCGIFLEKYGTTKIATDIETLYSDSMVDRNGSRTLNLLMKKMELDAIDGRRSTRKIGDRRVWHPGGLDEYIESTNADLHYPETGGEKNVVNFLSKYGTLSSTTLNSFLSDKFFWGNENEKFWVMPVRQYVGICNAFDNKVRIAYNKDLSLKYRINIMTLESSGGGMLHITISDLWSIYGRPFSYIIDFDSFKYMHLRNHDLQIIKDAEDGLNMFEIVNYIYGTYGYYRRNVHAHWKIWNVVPTE